MYCSAQCTPSVISMPASRARTWASLNLRKLSAASPCAARPPLSTRASAKRTEICSECMDSPLGSQRRKEPVGITPADRVHEGVDVVGGLGAIVDVIGVLVHVEGDDGLPARQSVAMVRRPLVDE